MAIRRLAPARGLAEAARPARALDQEGKSEHAGRDRAGTGDSDGFCYSKIRYSTDDQAYGCRTRLWPPSGPSLCASARSAVARLRVGADYGLGENVLLGFTTLYVSDGSPNGPGGGPKN